MQDLAFSQVCVRACEREWREREGNENACPSERASERESERASERSRENAWPKNVMQCNCVAKHHYYYYYAV